MSPLPLRPFLPRSHSHPSHPQKPITKTPKRQAHIRDGAALVAFFAWLERALEAGASGDGDKAAAAALGGLTWYVCMWVVLGG